MWDERYTESDQMWSGEPNGALVAEVQGQQPGRVLDVGCGEGADAIWLAQQGWNVTALDVSGVALARARTVAKEVGVDVLWLHAGLLEAALAPGGYDLVSAQYPALLRMPDHRAGRALLQAVAPGGTLLFVHHAHFGSQSADGEADGAGHEGHGHHEGHEGHGHHEGHEGQGGAEHEPGFAPENFVGPADIAELLGAGWRVEVDEQRPREVIGGAGAGHSEDVVLRAVRLV